MDLETIETKYPQEFFDPKLKMFTVMQIVKNKKTNHDDKKPLDPRDGAMMKWKKDPCFIDLNTALSYLKQLKEAKPESRYVIGMLVQHPYVLLDIDNIKDELNALLMGQTSERLKKIIKLTKVPYTEISQSGHGLHFIFRGEKTTTVSHTDKYELYDSNRWLALTGNCLHMPSKLPKLNKEEMGELEQYLFKDELEKKAKMSQNSVKSTQTGNNLELDQIINKIKNSKQADTFSTLWENQDGENPSSGDQALANILMWWCNHDTNKADQLFRQSKRMRPKWDEVHSSDGTTYGQMTLQKADETVDGGYTPKHQHIDTDNIDVKSMDDLIKKLQAQRMNWDLQHTDDKGNVAQIHDTDIIDIIEDTVPLKILYSDEMERPTALLYYYDFDEGIYKSDETTLEKFVLAVAPEKTSTTVRQNIVDTLRKKPSKQIVYQQLTTVTDKEHRFYAVANGVFDTKEKKLLPFDPQKWFYTSKIQTNYNENATVEPNYNGWSWSQNIQKIAGGQEDKEKLLWQTCRASILGCWWLRQAVILVDDGSGQTGKSTFEQALVNIVGKQNMTSLRLSEMADDEKLLDAVDKQLIVGDDNDANQPLKSYSNLNPIISAELIRVKKLFANSRLAQIHAFVLQSSNGLPPFENATQAVFKRLLVIKFTTQHNAKNPQDFAVKNDYIQREDFKEWLLNYVLNHVELTISLTDTKESQEILNESRLEGDSIGNFVNNWMPTIESTKLPSSWLYSLYATACTIDSISPLSKRIFIRKIAENPKFAKDWKKVHSVRIIPERDFTFNDANNLQKLSSTVKWGHHVQSFFPITRHTVSDGDNNHRESRSFDEITADDFKTTLQSFHGVSFVKK